MRPFPLPLLAPQRPTRGGSLLGTVVRVSARHLLHNWSCIPWVACTAVVCPVALPAVFAVAVADHAEDFAACLESVSDALESSK